MEMPPCEPTNLAFTPGYATHMRSWSYPLSQRKTANDDENGSLPDNASPLAMDTMLASAMPQVKKRSGNSFWNLALKVDLARSASSTTMLGFFLPSSTRAWPYASRVAAPILTSNFGLAGIAV